MADKKPFLATCGVIFCIKEDATTLFLRLSLKSRNDHRKVNKDTLHMVGKQKYIVTWKGKVKVRDGSNYEHDIRLEKLND